MRSLIKNILLVGGLSVLLFGCEKDGKKQEFYYSEPTVYGIYPTSGYTLSQVVINGENFGDRMEPISVFFGDKEAEIVSCKNNRIVTVVPEDASSGDVVLKVWTYEFESVGKFTVMPKPAITSVSSNNTLNNRFADEGNEITIVGTHFGNNANDVVAKVGDKEAEILTVADEEVKIKAPAGYGLGSVSLEIKGYEITGDYLMESSYTGDVTSFVLKNCSRPFATTDDPKDDVWLIPTDWLFNDNFYYEENGKRVLIRPLLFDGDNPDGCISFLCNNWSNSNHKDHPLSNAKMYQTPSLPAGKYTITFTVLECNTLGGNFGTIIGVTEGEGTLPDLQQVDGVWKPVDESAFVEDALGNKTYFRITDHITLAKDGPVDYSIEMQLDEPMQVTIGFVANISRANGGNINISKMMVNKE